MADEQTIQTMPNPQPNEGNGPAPVAASPLLPPQRTPYPEEGAPIPKNASNQPDQTSPLNPQGSPVDLPNYPQHWNNGDVGPGLSPKPNMMDKIMGGISQGAKNSWLGGTAMRLLDEATAQKGTQLTPDQANKLNPYRETPYTTNVDSNIVAMEAADGRKKQQMNEWLGRNDISGAGFGRFVGGLTDVPLYAAVGLATGGLGELAVGGAASMGRTAAIAARYAWTLGEFSMIGQAQNKVNATMGDREKSFGEVVQDSLLGAAIGTGAHLFAESRAAAREALNNGGGNVPNLEEGIKKNAAAMAKDERLPTNEETSKALAERKAGVALDPSGEKIIPVVKTSVTSEGPLYAGTHADGMPLIHEHGLGDGGVQLSNNKAEVNNGVSKSGDTPGQITTAKLPESAKTLDIDKPASADYGSKDSFLKAVEKKIGVSLEDVTKNGESIKDVITNLGDYAGADGTKIPDDVLKQIQDVAKEQGYHGYQFDGENSTRTHLFDPAEAGLEATNVEHADPDQTPDLPNAGQEAGEPPATPEAQEAEAKRNSQNYSPDAAAKIEEVRKTAKTLHPDDVEKQMAETEKTLAEHKQQLAELAKKFDEESNPKPYAYERKVGAEGDTYYHGTKGDSFKLSEASPTQYSDIKNLFGDGLYLTDNPEVAQSYAGKKGNVMAAELGKLNLIDLESPLPPDALKIFNEPIVQYDGKPLPAGTAGKDVFEALKEAMMDSGITTSDAREVYQQLGANLYDKGYQGLSHEGGVYVGGKGKHNVAIIFDSPYTNRIDPGLLKDIETQKPSAPVENPYTEQLKELKEQEVHDKRNLDMVKKMMKCAGGE